MRKIQKLGISQEIIELREKGLSYREIQKTLKDKGFKISHMAIRNFCEKIGFSNQLFTPQTNFYTKADMDEDLNKLGSLSWNLIEESLQKFLIAKKSKNLGLMLKEATELRRLVKVYKEISVRLNS